MASRPDPPTLSTLSVAQAYAVGLRRLFPRQSGPAGTVTLSIFKITKLKHPVFQGCFSEFEFVGAA